MNVVEIEDMTIAYQDKPVVWDLDLSVKEGSMTGVIGPNGAGKSTLLKGMLGLVPVTAGKVQFFGRPYKEVRTRISYVPQRNLVDWDFPTTVLDLVLMGSYGRLGWFARPGKEERYRAYEALDKVSMTDYAERQISQLSGGQQQRAFLARALMQESDLYVLDEPFQGVDATTERAIIGLLKHLRDENKTIIAVHHDLQTIEEYFDHCVLINVRKIADGPIATSFTSENLKRAYGGRVSFMEGRS